jgi:hypothetical protein
MGMELSLRRSNAAGDRWADIQPRSCAAFRLVSQQRDIDYPDGIENRRQWLISGTDQGDSAGRLALFRVSEAIDSMVSAAWPASAVEANPGSVPHLDQ